MRVFFGLVRVIATLLIWTVCAYQPNILANVTLEGRRGGNFQATQRVRIQPMCGKLWLKIGIAKSGILLMLRATMLKNRPPLSISHRVSRSLGFGLEQSWWSHFGSLWRSGNNLNQRAEKWQKNALCGERRVVLPNCQRKSGESPTRL